MNTPAAPLAPKHNGMPPLASLRARLLLLTLIILGFAELLQADRALDATQKSQVSEIIDSARDLQRLVDRLLELARLDAGQAGFEPQEVELGGLLQLAARAFAEVAAKRGVSLEVVPGETLARGDARLLRRLVDELLDNAIKFNAQGGKVSLRAGPAESEGRAAASAVQIEICDTGIGIAPDAMGRLFQPFVQLDAALNRRFGGTGLGLALARRIAELHGGEITVESRPGEGSCFKLRLPRA